MLVRCVLGRLGEGAVVHQAAGERAGEDEAADKHQHGDKQLADPAQATSIR